MDVTGLLAMLLNLAIYGVAFVFLVGVVATLREKLGRKSTSGDAAELTVTDLPPFETKLEQCTLEGPSNLPGIRILGRGRFPSTNVQRVAFVVSIMDRTTGAAQPVLSAVKDFAESNTPLPVFRFQGPTQTAGMNAGYGDWTQIVLLVPDMLVPPNRGERRLDVIVRLIDADNPPNISMGMASAGDPGVLSTYTQGVDWRFENAGYAEPRGASQDLAG